RAPDWSGWWAHYDDRLRQPFVRDWRKETRQNMGAAFAAESFRHATAVSALQRVPLRLDQSLAPLVDEFAAELMSHKGKKVHQRRANSRGRSSGHAMDRGSSILSNLQLRQARPRLSYSAS